MLDFTSLTSLLKDSTLENVLAEILAEVKAKPDDTQLRLTLFKLFCIEGLWEKAILQLQTLELMDPKAKQQTELFKNLVFSEMVRAKVLAGERTAGLLEADAPAWMETLRQANEAQTAGEHERADQLRMQAFDEVPESAGEGSATGKFSWLADSDGRIGPVCEFISAGGYRWVPFSAIQLINVSKPADVLDLIWAPAHIKVKEEIYYGYIPSRYPLREGDDQDSKLGRRTEWEQMTEILSVGKGRKVLITDSSEFSLLEMGEIVLS